MEYDLTIWHKKHLEANEYINLPVSFLLKSDFSIYSQCDFLWEGEFEGVRVEISLERNDPSICLKINGITNEEMKNAIKNEVDRVLKYLD